MAHLTNCSVVFFMVLALALLSFAAVTAQDSAISPSPAMDAGAGSPMTFSSASICFALFVSTLALLWH
ncbi:hypothetical protein HS088_TW15G01294 [Tripterygium wilfordii]|uniref:Uncharacterized protein n=1 Tax=Tripterygium wilfordii TaxID=458696 RepID=A0A7J7CP50_TRIWF|nr:hypothetical protein HS088_TW15G01294 [Tripterygium wilfordii]